MAKRPDAEKLPFKRGQVKDCKCGDLQNCRICTVREAHKHRMNGNEEKYESFYQTAVGLMEKERGGTLNSNRLERRGGNRRLR